MSAEVYRHPGDIYVEENTAFRWFQGYEVGPLSFGAHALARMADETPEAVREKTDQYPLGQRLLSRLYFSGFPDEVIEELSSEIATEEKTVAVEEATEVVEEPVALDEIVEVDEISEVDEEEPEARVPSQRSTETVLPIVPPAPPVEFHVTKLPTVVPKPRPELRRRDSSDYKGRASVEPLQGKRIVVDEPIEFSIEPEPWERFAVCAQTDPEAFFPEKGGSTREAKKVCSACDVRTECLDKALKNDERFGIWGGLSERERRKLKRRAV